MNKLTSIRIKQEDGTYSDDIIIQVLSDNVICEDDLTLTEVLDSLKTSIADSQSSIEANTTNIALQSGRIDKIVALNPGSTTGDAELQDIRVKVDGSISTTAGNAVRQQILQMSSSINEMGQRLEDNQSILSNFVNGAYVEDGVAYFTNDDVVMFSITGIGGGGGGGGGSSTNAVLTVQNQTGWLSKTIAQGSPCPITLEWSSIEDGMSTGAGTLKVITNGVIRSTMNIAQGVVTVDISKFLSQEKNNVRISISDVYGLTRTINFSVTMVSFSISSSFDNSIPFHGEITFPYTPVGAIDKTIYFYVDGTLIGTQETPISGRQLNYVIPMQSHGTHKLKVYFEAIIDAETVASNELYYEFASIDESSNIPIIFSNFNTTTANQYTSIIIPYIVYTPRSLTSDITISVNGNIISNQTVDRTQQTYTYRAIDAGNLALTIACGNVSKTFNITIESSTISVKAETEDLVLYLSSAGRSNNEANPSLWKYNNITANLTGFNWASDGWVSDNDGITVLRVAGDARVTIPYKPFADDFRRTGKTIEIEFATRDVRNYDAVIMSCMSGNRGLNITAQKALLKSEQSEISTQYKEDEHVRVTFVTEKRSENRLLLIYINGIASGAIQYPSDDDFAQINPVDISIGSNECIMDIYCIRIYDNNLNRFQILDNWMADKQIGAEMINTFTHNNVFDAYGNIIISQLPKDLPYMIIEAAQLPQYKGDKKTVTGSYVDPVDETKSFTFTGCQINVQGTSSAPYARKNYDMQFKSGFELAGGHEDNYALRETVVPFNRFVLKADVASSQGANNVELVRLYCDTCPFETREMENDSRIRQGIDGFPIVLFWYNTTTDTTQFMGKYNFNLPKRAPKPYGYSGDMESWEFQNNTSDLMLFKTDYFDETMYTDPDTGDTKELWRYDYEARFPSDEWTNYAKLQELQSFIVSTDRTKATDAALTTPITYNGESFTSDTAAYRLAKFKAEFGNYAEIDSFIFYYIFTELFLMVDSRAKNLFIGFSGSDTDPALGLTIDRKAVAEPYDMDTAMGTNNEGSLVFDYSLEDTDTLAGGAYIFNGQNSVLWCNLRDAFKTEIVNMYKTLRSVGTLSYNEVQNRFKAHQDKWPESIFNEDSWFKYIDPLINPDPGKAPTDIYLPMMQGSKAEQRKWWLYNRFRYMDSKWNAGDALSDLIQLRGYAKADITVTPYADVYPTVKYGSYLVQKRGHRGTATTLECPIDNVNDTEIYIYSASQLADIGDISPLKVGFADLSMATKLQHLKIGDASSNYTNPNLGVGSNTLSLGNNVLLQSLDVRNCVALGTGNQKSVDISGCTNIEEVYFDGTSIQGVTLPKGGILKKLHLPGTITNLTLVNQSALTEFVMPSFDNVTSLRLENVSNVINTKTLVSSIPAGARIRVIGFLWEAIDSAEIDSILDMLDTMRGIDEYGNNVNKAQMSGTIHTNHLYYSQIVAYRNRYPYITFAADHITAALKYYTWDGSQLLYTEYIDDGGNGGSYSGTPARASSADYTYTFIGWNSSQDSYSVEPGCLNNVRVDRNVYAAYSTTPIYHLYYYNYDGSELLYTESFIGGNGTGTYSGEPERAQTVHEAYTFVGWSTSKNATAAESGVLTIGTANKNVYAAYSVTQLVVISYYNYDGTELLHEEGVLSGGNGTWNGLPTRTATERILYNFAGWSSTTNASTNESGVRSNITQDTTVYAAYSETTITYLKYYNYDGSELLHTDTIYNSGNGSWAEQPARTATAQYSYSFVGWSTSMNSTTATSGATISVSADRNVYAAYSQTVRSYTVYFYNGSTLLQSKTVNYGASASYTGSTPVYNGSDPGEWTFTGWSPSPSNITGNTSCYAQYADTSSLTGKYLSGSMTSYNSSTNTTIGAYSLRNRTSMTTVSAPATTVGTYAFQGDTVLTTATFSGDDCSIGEYAFSGCTAITTVNLTGFGTPVISKNAFNGCSNMNALVISAGNIATLSSVNAFTGTKIARGAGAIYVQSSLVAVYKANANWSQFFIASLEDYPLTDFSSITDS